MALISLILIVLTAGVVDFSVYMYKYVQASNCVREAARRAVVRANDAESPPYCVDADLDPTVTSGYQTLPAGDEVVATIDTTYEWLALNYLIPGLPNTMPLMAQTSMRMEGQIE